MAYEHVYGTKLDERETEARIRQKAVAQQRLRSFPPRCVHGSKSSASRLVMFGHWQTSVHDPDAPSGFATPDQLVDKRGVPCEKVLMPDVRETAIETKRDSLATLASYSEHRVGPPSSPASQIRLPNPDIGDQDREYTHWGRLDDPDSVWNALHVERPKLSERRRFSSYKEYRKTRNQPMKDNDQLFKKRMRQSFARGEMEVLSVDGSGGYASDVDEDGDGDGEGAERGDEQVVVKKAEPKRQILLVKRKGNLAGQNL